MTNISPDTKICPWCGEEIKRVAIICRYCKKDASPVGFEEARRLLESRQYAVEKIKSADKEIAHKIKNTEHNNIAKFVPDTILDAIIEGVKGIKEGELRSITILFSDLSGFTPLTSKIGAEAMSEILQELYKEIKKIVNHYGGIVEKFIGDEVMAVFGAPISHGDDPERAIRAAIDIREFVVRMGRARKKKLDAHAGIAYGEVVFESSKEGEGINYLSIGNAVNIAARLRAKAASGELFVDNRIYNQTRTMFKWEDHGFLKFKGIADSVHVHSVTGIQPHSGVVTISERIGFVNFVGREKELGILSAAAKDLLAGKNKIVYIKGDAGVGKSRLVYEYLNALPENKINTFTARSVSYGIHIPFHPFIRLIKNMLGFSEEGSEIISSEEIRRRVNDLLKLMPLFKENPDFYISPKIIAGISDSISFLLSASGKRGKNPLLNLSPKERRSELFKNFSMFITLISLIKPSILVFEDFHWGDADSIELLDFLISDLKKEAILFLIITRPEFDYSFSRREESDFIEINELTGSESRALLNQLLRIDNIPKNLEKIIYTKASGNPFFIEEIILHLLEQGAIEKSENTYRIKIPIEEIYIPDRVEGLVLARLDRLEQTSREILKCASVIGHEFQYKTMEYLTEVRERLSDYLFSLVQKDYILEKSAIPELIYIFKHIILRDVAYKTLLEKRRKFFHEKVGNIFEDIFSRNIDEYVEIIAYHFEKAEVLDKSIFYLERAAKKCENLYCNLAAVNHYERLLNQIKKSGKSIKKYPEILIEANIHLGELQRILGNINRSIDAFKKALCIAEKQKAKESIINAKRGLAEGYRLNGKNKESLEQLEESVNFARTMKNKVLLADCLNLTGHYERMMGKNREAEKHFESALKISEETGDRINRYQSLNHLGIISMISGKLLKANQYYIDALALAHELRFVDEEVQIRINIGINFINLSNTTNALMHLEAAIADAKKFELERSMQLALLAKSDLLLKTGRFHEVETLCSYLIKRAVKFKYKDIYDIVLCNKAGALLNLNKIPDSKSIVKKILDDKEANLIAKKEAFTIFIETLITEKKYSEALDLCFEKLKQIRKENEKESLHCYLILTAKIYIGQKDFKRAEESALELLKSSDAVNFARDKAWAFYLLGITSKNTKKISECKKYFKSASDIANKINDAALIKKLDEENSNN